MGGALNKITTLLDAGRKQTATIFWYTLCFANSSLPLGKWLAKRVALVEVDNLVRTVFARLVVDAFPHFLGLCRIAVFTR